LTNVVKQTSLGWKTQAEENEALLYKGYRGKPVFTSEENTLTGESRILLGGIGHEAPNDILPR